MNFLKALNLLALSMSISIFSVYANVEKNVNTELTNNIVIDFENINLSEEIDINNSFAEGLEDITDALNTSHNSDLNRSFIEIDENDSEPVEGQNSQIQGNDGIVHVLQLDLRVGYTYQQTMAEHSTLQCKRILPN